MNKWQPNNNSDDKQQKKTNPALFALYIGFCAGVIWGMVRWLNYGLKFTTEVPGYWLEPFFRNSFLKTIWGGAAGIGSYIVFSIVAALIYQFLLQKWKGPWPGIFYGFGWWFLIFICVGPWMKMTASVTTAGWVTLFTELCVMLLWGVFIGYTISFEFNDEASREPVQILKP